MSTATQSTCDIQILAFSLGTEHYGIEISRIREIIGIIDITPLPQTPDYVKGVINLRGRIIPVLDLRSRFDLESVEHTDETCIIVIELTNPDSEESIQMGAVVDTVSEVMDIDSEQVEAPPRLGCSISTDYIQSLGKVDDRVIVMLDIDRLLSETEVRSLTGAADEQSPASELLSTAQAA